MQKADYGIDAPGVIRNLAIFSAVGFAVAFFSPKIQIGSVNVDPFGFILMGFSCGLMSCWMLLYSMYGKLRHRDRILAMVSWKGDEKVLDIGTGRGLLMIGAAKKLTTGRSTGIDIWNAEDLASNKIELTLQNTVLEGVKEKTEILNENVIRMNFADNTFDIILSNLCIHNIYNKEDRKKACAEIARVLKKGGTCIISDFKHMKEYKANFDELGLQTKLLRPSYFTTFPPLAILKITK